jgi:hypothetical protein
MNVLVNHPYFGSVWLGRAYYDGDYVVGDAWDDSDVGRPNMPEDYRGQPVTLNFPKMCIRKVEP